VSLALYPGVSRASLTVPPNHQWALFFSAEGVTVNKIKFEGLPKSRQRVATPTERFQDKDKLLLWSNLGALKRNTDARDGINPEVSNYSPWDD
jgi:hypothetical protein